ncbi:mucoidy inhibitor MuiA family protein [Actomonas aquatica]|uniref:Mucoidy inhibitor MuiA family protein n=1 Tax=Actomonas aquatica TaxID=2866162 RepID=A0ABZ1C3Q1_9BACT|nr:mucoidy inhibitor MuiA family protein [Opitutus sp. WL0086]WRQ86309.1 mucoidy inhibitor MuiA family protein [Opitutus sp. WL0086]
MTFLRRRLPALCLLLTSAALLSAAPTKSTITAVTVYPDRALVERHADLTLPAGESTITLTGLPANLWDNSLQVRGSGPAGTTILDVNARNVFVESEPSPQIRELEQSLESLRDQDQTLADKVQLLDRESMVLDQIIRAQTTPPTEGPAAPRDLSELQNLLSFAAENQARLATAKRNLSDQREDLAQKIAAAQAQLNEARGRLPGRRAVKEVTVRLTTSTAGPGQLALSYTVPGARWAPVYNARLDSTAREVAFDYQASVTNRTGEPWTNVALTLSTARPSAGGSAPEAQPWIVAELEQRRRYADEEGITLSAFSVSRAAAPAPELKIAGRAEVEADMAVAQATVETGLTAATFKITAPATIPADGTTQKVSVTTVTLPAGLRYDSTPKYIASAFLSATVSNTTDFPLLGGPLASFVDGAFIANSQLETTMPGEDFDLALGVDEGIAIERDLTNRFVEKTGFTNSGTRVTYEVKLTLTNHKSVPVTLRIAEPLPVSRHEKIKVELLSPTARDIATGDDKSKAFHRDEEGILTWTGSLAPGASRTLDLKFSIEHPNDLPVTGVE